MLIDWFTVGAQVVNFLILVWLMKRYLYKPVLHAIDAREKHIVAQLADADRTKTDAGKERNSFRQKNATFDEQHSALMKQARDEAQAELERLLEKNEATARSRQAKREETFRKDASAMSLVISRRAQREVLAIARKALSDLADVSLEARITEEFIRRLRGIAAPAREQLIMALESTEDPVLIRSAFELPADLREDIQRALNETLSAQVPLRFTVAPEIACGIELTSSGQKVAWSIEEYLKTFESIVSDLVNEKVSS